MESAETMPARFVLDRLLDEARLSQRELAARSGVSPTTINRMANNLTGQVSLKTLDSLARVLSKATGRKVRPGELIEEIRVPRQEIAPPIRPQPLELPKAKRG
jgi:transcriptional regulator with XRE-family HTH domain